MLHEATNRQKRFSSTERKWQILYTLLFNGPLNLKEIAYEIAKHTNENPDSIRVILYRNITKLMDLKLIHKGGRKYDITPFGIYFLFFYRGISQYLPFAILKALENRYKHLFRYITLICLACNESKNARIYELPYSWNKIRSLEDEYVSIELLYEKSGNTTFVTDIRVKPKMNILLNNIREQLVDDLFVIEKTLSDILFDIYSYFYDTSNYEEIHEIIDNIEKCLLLNQCNHPVMIEPLIKRYGEELIRKYFNIGLDTPEAYFLFEIVSDIYHSYIEDCPISTLFYDIISKYYDKLGLLSRHVVVWELEYHIANISTWVNIIRFYLSKVVNDPFIITLTSPEILEIEEQLNYAIQSLKKLQEQIKK